MHLDDPLEVTEYLCSIYVEIAMTSAASVMKIVPEPLYCLFIGASLIFVAKHSITLDSMSVSHSFLPGPQGRTETTCIVSD